MTPDSLWEELIFEMGTIVNSGNNQSKKFIIGSGNRKAPILFIGDDSNLFINENLSVQPGSSGEFLVKLCDTSEIYPDLYYITTLTKTELKFREYFEKDQVALKDLLDMQIALINPKIIVALGDRVAEILLNREVNFQNERGEVLDFAGNMKLLITFEPSFAKQSRENLGKKSQVAIDFWNDLKQIYNFINSN